MSRVADHQIIADIACCVGFFTRLPVPASAGSARLADALWAAPVAGAVVGLIVGGTMLIGAALGLPPSLAALLGVAAGIAASGALHEDGAADVADGFWGGRTRDDRLAIMRDSRIGTYGTIAIVLSIGARWAALAEIATASGWTILFAAIAAHATSRAILPLFAARVPPARTDGLSAGLGMVRDRVATIAAALGFVLLMPSGIGFAVVGAILLAGVFVLMERLCRRAIGGQTGDVLGALQQCCEIVLLLALAAKFS